MRTLHVLAAVAASALPIIAQGAQLEVTNFRGVISTATHPTTGNPYPYPPTTPPGYATAGSGVAAGTRCWIYTPKLRLRAGHQNPNYVTITGMSQVIRPGAGTTLFPNPAHYQFETGLAPAAATPLPAGFQHAPTGADLLSFPAGTVNITSFASFRHNFTLSTPVAMPDVELCLFVQYKGGEQQDDPNNNQTLRADWRGGPPFVNGVFYGFTVGQSPRTISLTTQEIFRGQIGMIVDEPMFTATGYHANNYDPSPPLTGEDFRGLAASYADWSTNGSVNATLFFHVSAGGTFANGLATVLANLGASSPTIRFPLPFGFLLVNPVDPLLTMFPDAGLVMPLDPSGFYNLGQNTPLTIPAIPGLAGKVLTTQGIVLDAAASTFKLTNSAGISIR